MFSCCFFLCCNYNTVDFLSAIGLTIRGLAEFVVEARPSIFDTSWNKWLLGSDRGRKQRAPASLNLPEWFSRRTVN
jgi:hypothetical protein